MRFGLELVSEIVQLVSEIVLISSFNRLFIVTNKYLMSRQNDERQIKKLATSLVKNLNCKFKLVMVRHCGNLVNVNYFVIEIKVSHEVPAVYCLPPVILR